MFLLRARAFSPSHFTEVNCVDLYSRSPVGVLMAEGGASTIFIIINDPVTRGKVSETATV